MRKADACQPLIREIKSESKHVSSSFYKAPKILFSELLIEAAHTLRAIARQTQDRQTRRDAVSAETLQVLDDTGPVSERTLDLRATSRAPVAA